MALSNAKPGTRSRRASASAPSTRPVADGDVPVKRGRGRPPRVEKQAEEASQYPPELRAKILTIEQRLATSGKREIRDMLEVGQEVDAILKTPAYGVTTYKDIAKLFSMGRDTVRPCYVLATEYEEADINRLLELKDKKTNLGLMKSHIIHLTRVKNPVEALTLAKDAIENSWSPSELRKRVTEAMGGKKSKGGRKMKPVETLTELSTQVLESADVWGKRCTEVWMKEKSGLPALIKAGLKSGVSASEVEAVTSAAKAVQDMVTKAEQLYMEMNRAARVLAEPIANGEVHD